MISYALSTSSVSPFITETVANAIRSSKFRNYEFCFKIAAWDEDALAHSNMARQLVKEGAMNVVSVHMPFHNGTEWDASYPNETIRRRVVNNHIRLLRESADFIGRHVTLHASGEPPMEEHPERMDKICRTLEELMPTLEEFNYTINIEYLPRTCVGNCVEEIREILKNFDASRVGVCMDVNHIMDRYKELPDIIRALAPRINTFHISDYDGVDETHWMPGQGVYNWGEILDCIHEIDHDVVLIFETNAQLRRNDREIDPVFRLRQNEKACFFMENFRRLTAEINDFIIPGNN